MLYCPKCRRPFSGIHDACISDEDRAQRQREKTILVGNFARPEGRVAPNTTIVRVPFGALGKAMMKTWLWLEDQKIELFEVTSLHANGYACRFQFRKINDADRFSATRSVRVVLIARRLKRAAKPIAPKLHWDNDQTSFQEALDMCADRCFWTQIWLAVVSGKSIENVAEDFGYSVDCIASIVNRYMDAYVRQTGALPQRWRPA
jgi:hypothetical protein